MKKNKKIYTSVLLTLLVCSSLSVRAMDSLDEFKRGSSSESGVTLPFQGMVNEEGEIIEEDETIFSPLESERETFLYDECLVLDHSTKQNFGDEDIEPQFGLSIDGGGIRGLMPAIWLKMLHEELEEQGFSGKLSKVFDYVGGTSIGGILALGVAADLEPENLVNLLETRGEEVFPKKGQWKIKLKTLGGLIGSRYNPTSLETLLQENFDPEWTFDDLNTNTLVTTCTTQGKPTLFRSFSNSDKGHKLWEIARCTSAAPTYFPAHNLSTHTDAFIDGGMWINNPSPLVATSIVQEGHQGKFVPQNIYMLSLGTGDMSLQTNLSKNSGILSAGSLINVLMNSNSHGNHETMQSFLGNHYYRVNPFISQNIDLAATDKKTLTILRGAAEQDLAKREIKKFAKKVRDVKRWH